AGCARRAGDAYVAGHAAPVLRVGDPHRPGRPLLAAWHLAVRPRARAAIGAVGRASEFRPDLDRRLVGRMAIRLVRGALAATPRAHDDDLDRDRHPGELRVLGRGYVRFAGRAVLRCRSDADRLQPAR